ncbi:MAG: hypothetical protein GY940_24555 [bacterium]|nr:hypothetical protein [bacterium]
MRSSECEVVVAFHTVVWLAPLTSFRAPGALNFAAKLRHNFALRTPHFALSLFWLVAGKQDMFISKGIKTPDHAYLLTALLNCNDPEILMIMDILVHFCIPPSKQQIIDEIRQHAAAPILRRNSPY